MFSSGIVQLANIDDFITPSTKCIKNLNEEATTVKLTLNDCLACSGCVTTAETILLEKQGAEVFLSKIPTSYTIVCLSEQTITAYQQIFKKNREESCQIIGGALKELGIK